MLELALFTNAARIMNGSGGGGQSDGGFNVRAVDGLVKTLLSALHITHVPDNFLETFLIISYNLNYLVFNC